MMKKIVVLTFALVLSGCHTRTNPINHKGIKSPDASEIKSQCEAQTPQQTQQREVMLWICQASTSIQHRFFDADTYRGKTCDVRIKLAQRDHPVKINVVGGDPDLCVAATEAINQAVDNNTFPVGRPFQKDSMTIHFAPQ